MTVLEERGLARQNFVAVSRERVVQRVMAVRKLALVVAQIKFGRVYPPKLLRKFVLVKAALEKPLPEAAVAKAASSPKSE